MQRLALVIAVGCASAPEHPTTPPPKPRAPIPAKPLAVLDDLKPFRSYSALSAVRDNPDHSRTVELVTLSPTDYAKGTRRIGWITHTVYTLDAKLEHITSSLGDDWSGFGVLELPADGQWLGVNVSLMGPPVIAALARYDAHEPSPAPTSFVPADAPMVPEGYVPRVTVRALVGGGGDVRASFALSEAVFGPYATATTIMRHEGNARMTVTLTPTAVRTPSAGHTSAEYTGALSVHFEDDYGRSASREYLASGHIELEGNDVIAPTGFGIPGASCPSTACDLRKLVLPAGGGHPELYIDVEGIEPFDGRHDSP